MRFINIMIAQAWRPSKDNRITSVCCRQMDADNGGREAAAMNINLELWRIINKFQAEGNIFLHLC